MWISLALLPRPCYDVDMTDTNIRRDIIEAALIVSITNALDNYHSKRLPAVVKAKVLVVADAVVKDMVHKYWESDSNPSDYADHVAGRIGDVLWTQQIRIIDRFGEDHTESFTECYLPQAIRNYCN